MLPDHFRSEQKERSKSALNILLWHILSMKSYSIASPEAQAQLRRNTYLMNHYHHLCQAHICYVSHLTLNLLENVQN